MNQMLNDIIIAGLSFSDTAVEITYFQKSTQSDGVQVMEVMTIDIDETLDPLVEEILDAVRELVDAGLLLRRNPPKSFLK